MVTDVQFSEKNQLQLIPRGQGFLAEDEINEWRGDGIDKARRDFQASAKRPGAKLEGRKSRDEKQFVSKANFILKHRNFENCFEDREDVLLSLLADTATLFSRSYQVYTMNHEFYRDLRSQHGKTQADELRCCRNRALHSIRDAEQRKRYEFILSRLEDKATAEGLHIIELEQMLIVQSISGMPTGEGEKRRLTSSGGCRLFYNNRKVYAYGCVPDRLCAILRKWFSDIELKPDEESTFALDVLWTYFAQASIIPAEKQAAGHHFNSYTSIDTIRYQQYKDKKRRLRVLVQRYKEWESIDYKHIFQSDTDYELVETHQHSGRFLGDKGKFESICSITKDFLQLESDISGGVENILDCIEQSGSDISEFPFHYLMVVATGGNALFSGARILSGGTVLNTCKSLQNSGMNLEEQRIKRIECLRQLNQICDLDRATRSKNWNLFLTVHGTEIRSRGEVELWRSILYGETSENTKKEPQEDIPVIELTLLCLDCLRNCLPDEMETLYCYSIGSNMHQGGFAKFLEQYPKILNDYTMRLQRKDIAAERKKYLEEWAKPDCNLTVIQKLCRDRAVRTRWDNDLKQKLEFFCLSLYQKNNVSKDVEQLKNLISENVQELKDLLIEAAFRRALNDEASTRLATQIEKLLSRGPHKIVLTKCRQFYSSEGGNFLS